MSRYAARLTFGRAAENCSLA